MENYELLLNEHVFNLSDFALFLSVMKVPRAYQCVLSIFMEEPDIELVEVKVEQVILNKAGKRAIRLDAWAKSKDQRQFNMEMQNDSKADDLRKSSRFYQSMIDTPILKSGKKTRYRNLPSTVIIIFLNMESKNGFQELISLLQYMKDTRIDNPEIITKDSRILEIDGIVQEVKSSEEWEAVKMNVLEVGIVQGAQQKLMDQVKKEIGKRLYCRRNCGYAGRKCGYN